MGRGHDAFKHVGRRSGTWKQQVEAGEGIRGKQEAFRYIGMDIYFSPCIPHTK